MALYKVSDMPEDGNPFDVLPKGEYPVVVSKTERKKLKDERKGERLAVELTVTEGPYEGRKIFNSYNLWYVDLPDVDEDKRGKTKQISEAQFGTLIKACGLVEINLFEDLLDIPCIAVVGVKPARDGYDESNEVKTMKPRGGTKPARTGASWRK